MSFKTRLDSRSEKNNSFQVVDSQGNPVAEITATGSGTTLEVATYKGHTVVKPNGWSSKPNKE